MVYIDPADLGWKPYFETWLCALPKVSDAGKDHLRALAHKALPDALYRVRKTMTEGMAQVDISKVAALCCLLQQLIISPATKIDWEASSEEDINATLSYLFLFCFVWGLGGNLVDKDQAAFDTLAREAFSDIKAVKIPSAGTVYDYFVNMNEGSPALDNWETIVPQFTYNQEVPFFDLLVPTASTVKFSFLLETLALAGKAVLFTGLTGVGKSVIARECLKQLQANRNVVPVPINFSAQTSSQRTQEIIESKLEKKRKNIMGAPNNKRIVIFVDDLNMPKRDTYGAQPPIELLRQFQDFGGFYDREKLFWKEIQDVTLAAACAPPGGGRNPVTPRFIRHFAMFCIQPADQKALTSIFIQIMEGFFTASGFSKSVSRAASSIVSAAVEIYERMSTDLLPTPAKSHYVFNLRDLSKCVQGILQADPTQIKEHDQIWEVFCHESMRVFHDRLINHQDKSYFCNILAEMSNKHFGKVKKKKNITFLVVVVVVLVCCVCVCVCLCVCLRVS